MTRKSGDSASESRTHFGDRSVSRAEKPLLVRRVFESVAPQYDLMNDLMSGGLHRLWKTAFVDALAPRPDERILDIAGGTGDIAFRMADRTARRFRGTGPAITVMDVNEAMIAAGRQRREATRFPGIRWAVGDAETLPIADGAADAVTIAFGIRNVTRIEAALAEARRVLRPGGRCLCLEFSRVAVPLLDRLYDRYSYAVIPRLGAWIAGDAESYRYLVESIRRFPSQSAFAGMMARAGFARVTYRNLSGGIVAMHSGWRI